MAFTLKGTQAAGGNAGTTAAVAGSKLFTTALDKFSDAGKSLVQGEQALFADDRAGEILNITNQFDSATNAEEIGFAKESAANYIKDAKHLSTKDKQTLFSKALTSEADLSTRMQAKHAMSLLPGANKLADMAQVNQLNTAQQTALNIPGQNEANAITRDLVVPQAESKAKDVRTQLQIADLNRPGLLKQAESDVLSNSIARQVKRVGESDDVVEAQAKVVENAANRDLAPTQQETKALQTTSALVGAQQQGKVDNFATRNQELSNLTSKSESIVELQELAKTVSDDNPKAPEKRAAIRSRINALSGEATNLDTAITDNEVRNLNLKGLAISPTDDNATINSKIAAVQEQLRNVPDGHQLSALESGLSKIGITQDSYVKSIFQNAPRTADGKIDVAAMQSQLLNGTSGGLFSITPEQLEKEINVRKRISGQTSREQVAAAEALRKQIALEKQQEKVQDKDAANFIATYKPSLTRAEL